MKKKQRLSLLLALALLTVGCGRQDSDGTPPAAEQETPASGEIRADASGEAAGTAETPAETLADASEVFSERDMDTDYKDEKSALIRLNGDSAACDSDAVRIAGSTVTILDEGTYILSGTLDDGMVIVDAEKTDKTRLVLDGVTIHSETGAPIYIRQADKVFLTTAEGSDNTLANGGGFTAIDENNIDAVIFSKEDVTLNGTGALTVTSPAGHGIVSKDSLTVAGGTYAVHAASHALAGKDDVCIAAAALQITAGKDGIHAENSDDASLGFVYIQNGTFEIEAEGDGISAAAYLQIEDGSFTITAGGGSANAAVRTSENWGGFMGGGRQPGGKNPGGKGMGGKTTGGSFTAAQPAVEETEEDSTSIKGIKAGGELRISGGTFVIDSADDAIHSNASATVSGGSFEIASGDDAFHADETLTIAGGTVSITKSYEGLGGLHVVVSGGEISLIADDDGINAAGGNDQSGFGGMRGKDQFGGKGGGMSSSGGSILISGGRLYVQASGDGIDANGTLTISGGDTIVCGPTKGDTATLDYDVSAEITGGTFIGTGAASMAQGFSSGSTQGTVSVRLNEKPAGTAISLCDQTGNVILSHTPELPFAVAIFSSPAMVQGETYTFTVGDESGNFAAK